ncbi:MAG: type VI secretion system baseplate subunit TssK [Rhodopila sp.]
MTWSNRIAWLEGMFLSAQHFQQQDRWVEAQIWGRITGLRPHPWGFLDCTLARDMLATGRFAIASASGVFEDGTPFAIPDEVDAPPPIELMESARNVLVYLAVPARRPGMAEMAGNNENGRYRALPFEAYDTHSGATQPAEVQIGRLQLRYLLETDDRDGYQCLPVARIIEVASDRRVLIDDRWLPPALTCGAATPLSSALVELSGLLNHRGEALAARLTAVGTKSNTEAADFALLQAINSWQPLLAHYADSGNVHPETLYGVLVRMAGEFATFTDPRRRPNAYPGYRHYDLQRSFAPVIADLHRSLSAVLEQTAIRIPLQERRHGVRVGVLSDRSLLSGSSFVLVVKADMPAEALRRTFPGKAKIGTTETIRDLVNVALPGIELRSLPVAPRQMPFVAGALYFELDRNSPHWTHMQGSAGFAIHVSGDFPNLSLDLWSIRG